MKPELRSLLDALEAVGREHEELYDTDVREQMSEAIVHGFIEPEPGYALASEFGMFSAEGDAAVHRALAGFLAKSHLAARVAGLDTPAKRLEAFQDCDVVTSQEGQAYDSFFGHVDAL